MAPGGQQAVNTALSLTFRAAFAVLVACVRLPVRVCTKAATAVAALVAAIGAALEKVAGCWRCWSPQCCSVLCRVVVLACVCFAPQCRLHTYCPHSDRSGLWCSLGMCAPAAGVVSVAFVVCVAIAKWSQGAAFVAPSFPSRSLKRDCASPVSSDRAFLPVFFVGSVSRCRSPALHTCALMCCALTPLSPTQGIGLCVRSRQAFLKWGLVTASLSILLHPFFPAVRCSVRCVSAV
jgi:hypothetical protein